MFRRPLYLSSKHLFHFIETFYRWFNLTGKRHLYLLTFFHKVQLMQDNLWFMYLISFISKVQAEPCNIDTVPCIDTIPWDFENNAFGKSETQVVNSNDIQIWIEQNFFSLKKKDSSATAGDERLAAGFHQLCWGCSLWTATIFLREFN